MTSIPSRVLAAYASVPIEDGEYQTIKLNPFMAATLHEPLAGPETRTKICGSGDDYVNQGWSESPDGRHAIYTSEFGYVTILP